MVQAQRQEAAQYGEGVAQLITSQIESVHAPLFTLASVVKLQPNRAQLDVFFQPLATRLLSEYPAAQNLYLAPAAVVLSQYYEPPFAFASSDILASPTLGPAMIASIAKGDGVFTAVGPLKLATGKFGMAVRLPIFVVNGNASDSWGFAPVNPVCGRACAPQGLAGARFWGAAISAVDFQPFLSGSDPRLLRMRADGYDYLFLDAMNNNTLFSASPTPPVDPVSVPVTGSSYAWQLLISPSGGWAVQWEQPVLAASVVAACLVALLVTQMQASWSRRCRNKSHCP